MQSEQLKLSGTKTRSGQPENFYKLRGKCNKFGRFFYGEMFFAPITLEADPFLTPAH